MNNIYNIFFIIGCGRSGTSAVTQILDTGENALVTTEKDPKLCIAARAHYHKILPYPEDFIYKSIVSKIIQAGDKYDIYGDKNPNYIHFIEELYSVFKCKFIFVIRDGRDVVRSCMDFDLYRTPTYHRYEDDPLSNLTQPEDDFWDYARLRPLKKDPFFKKWRELSKFEKYCWLWANYNRLLLDMSKKIPEKNYRFINLTKSGPEEIKQIFDFLGLIPFNQKKIQDMLTKKINTTEVKKNKPFERWESWSDKNKKIFYRHSAQMMKKFGFEL